MNGLSLDMHLLKLMFKEEWRLHRSLIGGFGSGFFPIMIFLFSLASTFAVPFVTAGFASHTLLLLLHVGAVFYGFFVGALGGLGEEAMTRRFGQLSMLLQLPRLYPVSFRKVMAFFYIKDAVFYLVYTIIPILLGIGVGGGLAGLELIRVPILGVSFSLSFLIGMGVSFLVSATAIRSKLLSYILTGIVSAVIISVWPLGILEAEQVLPPLNYWRNYNSNFLYLSALTAIAFASIAVMLMRERVETRAQKVETIYLDVADRLGRLGDLGSLAAKEWLEVRRSGALIPMVSGFIGPLLAVYFMIWLLRSGFGLPLHFNVVFFGGFIGFMGVMTYSWLNNLEPNEFLNSQPTSVDRVISAKLLLYFALTLSISLAYIIGIGVLNGELHLIIPAIVFSSTNTIYVAAVTSYLTGVWTNTMLFDARTLTKFSALCLPPLIAGVISSFWIYDRPGMAYGVLLGLAIMLVVFSFLMFRRLSSKWGGKVFSFVSIPS